MGMHHTSVRSAQGLLYLFSGIQGVIATRSKTICPRPRLLTISLGNRGNNKSHIKRFFGPQGE